MKARSGVLQRGLLVERVVDHSGPALIQAPGGYGKSLLLSQILARFAELGIEPGPDSRDLAVVDLDRAHSETPLNDAYLERLEELLERRRVVVISTRGGDAGFPRELLNRSSGLMMTLYEDELRFTEAEIEELLSSVARVADDGAAEVVSAITGGWPRHVDALVRRLTAGPGPMVGTVELAAAPEIDIVLAEAVLGELAEADRHAVYQLAQLTDFSPQVADSITASGAIGRLLANGAPLTEFAPGFWRFSPAVERAGRASGRLDPRSAELMAPALIATRGVMAAIRGLLVAGAETAAAELLVSAPGAGLDEVNQPELIGLLSLLEEEAADRPRLHLHRARTLGRLARLRDQTDALVQTVQGSRRVGDIDLELEARIELLYNEAMAKRGDLATLELELAEIERLAPTRNRQVRTRLVELRAMAYSQQDDLARVAESETLFLQAATEWQHLNELGRAARCLRMLAAGTYTHLGNYQAATSVLERCLDLIVNRPWDLALTTELLCRMDALCRDPARFARREKMARALIRTTDVRWLDAYLSWSSMHIAAHRRDVQSLRHLYSRARMQLGELLDDKTGIVFLSESASLFAEVNYISEATALLEDASARAEPGNVEVAIASVVVAARAADIEAAERLATEAARDASMPPDRLWRLWLEFGRAAGVASGAEAAPAVAENLQRAIDQATDLGLEKAVESLLRDTSSSPTVDAPPLVRVEVLGDFRVFVTGAEVTLPPGHVSTMVKLLAANDGPVALDVVLDILWPGIQAEVARRRLKNVVVRARRILGQDAIDRSSTALALGEHVVVDLMSFGQATRQAMEAIKSSTDAAIDLTIDALELYGGPLIPIDLYDDWVELRRTTQRSRATLLLGQLLAEPAAVQVAPAWLLDRCLAIQPDDPHVYISAGRYALACGQPSVAAEALGYAEQIGQDLGLPQPSQLAELDEEVAFSLGNRRLGDNPTEVLKWSGSASPPTGPQ